MASINYILINIKKVLVYFLVIFIATSFTYKYSKADDYYRSGFYFGASYINNLSSKVDTEDYDLYIEPDPNVTFRAGFDVVPWLSIGAVYAGSTEIMGKLISSNSSVFTTEEATKLYDVATLGAELKLYPRLDRAVGDVGDWQPYFKVAYHENTYDLVQTSIASEQISGSLSVLQYGFGFDFFFLPFSRIVVEVYNETVSGGESALISFGAPPQTENDIDSYKLTLGVDLVIPFNSATRYALGSSNPSASCPLSLAEEPKFCVLPEDPASSVIFTDEDINPNDIPDE